jgi:hypothetical protein
MCSTVQQIQYVSVLMCSLYNSFNIDVLTCTVCFNIDVPNRTVCFNIDVLNCTVCLNIDVLTCTTDTVCFNIDVLDCTVCYAILYLVQVSTFILKHTVSSTIQYRCALLYKVHYSITNCTVEHIYMGTYCICCTVRHNYIETYCFYLTVEQIYIETYCICCTVELNYIDTYSIFTPLPKLHAHRPFQQQQNYNKPIFISYSGPVATGDKY